jgi:hypothetical protein
MPKLELTVPAESLSDDARQELARDLGAALLRWEGAPDTEFFRSEAGFRMWTLIRDIPEGNWGAGGQVVRFQQLGEAAIAEPVKEGSGSDKVPATATAWQE